MAKRTKKVGVVGKYGTRYGGAIRKIVKKFELQQRAKYVCPPCGKVRIDPLSNKSAESLPASGDAKAAGPPSQGVPTNSLPALPPPPKSQWTVSRSSRRSSPIPWRRKLNKRTKRKTKRRRRPRKHDRNLFNLVLPSIIIKLRWSTISK